MDGAAARLLRFLHLRLKVAVSQRIRLSWRGMLCLVMTRSHFFWHLAADWPVDVHHSGEFFVSVKTVESAVRICAAS